MPPGTKNLGVGIKVDDAKVKAELDKLKNLIQSTFGSLPGGIQAVTQAIQAQQTQMTSLTKTVQDLTYKMGQLATSHKQVQAETSRTGLEILHLKGGIQGYIKDLETMIAIQARWYGAKMVLFATAGSFKTGVEYTVEVDKAQAQLLRYDALEGQVTEAHRRAVEEITTYSRQLALRLPVDFEKVVQAADRLRAAGADIDTVKGSLKSFAELQVAFPEINPERFTNALIGILNTFRSTPGLREYTNDAERLIALMDKASVVLAKTTMAPQDLPVLIQHLGQMSQAAGFSIDQMMALSGMIVNLGSKAGPAGRALRGFMDSLSMPKGQDALAQIGVTLDKTKTIAEQLPTIIEGIRKAVGTGEGTGMSLGGMEFLRDIASTERRSALIALLREFEKYQEYAEASKNAQGGLSRAADVMTNSISGQLKILGNLTKELGKALVTSDLFKDGVTLLIGVLKGLGFVLSGLVGVSSLVVDGFKYIYYAIMAISSPVAQLMKAGLSVAMGDYKQAAKDVADIGKVQSGYEEKAWDALNNSMDRAGKRVKEIQDVLFKDWSKDFTGGAGNPLKALTDLLGGDLGNGPKPRTGMEVAAVKEYYRALLLEQQAYQNLALRYAENFHRLGLLSEKDYYDTRVETIARNRDIELGLLELEKQAIEDTYRKGIESLGSSKDAAKKKALDDKRIADLQMLHTKEMQIITKGAADVDTAYTQREQERHKRAIEGYKNDLDITKIFVDEKLQTLLSGMKIQEQYQNYLYETGGSTATAYYEAILGYIDAETVARKQAITEQYEAGQQRLDREYTADGTTYERKKQILLEQEKDHFAYLAAIEKETRSNAEARVAIELKAAEDIRRVYEQLGASGAIGRSLRDLAWNYGNTGKNIYDSMNSLAQQTETSWSTALDYSSKDFMNWGKLATDIIHEVYMELVKVMLIRPMISGMAQGIPFLYNNYMGGYLNGINGESYVPPPRAEGGPVSAGETYLIGEKGRPELLHMGRNSGYVSPIVGGGDVNIKFEVTNSTGIPNLNFKQTGTRMDEATRTKVIMLQLFSKDIDFLRAMKEAMANA